MDSVLVRDCKELDAMPAEYKEVLTHQLLAHTEGELSGGDTYILWAPFAIDAYELKIIYQSAADEINHYMIGAKLLKDMGVDVKFMLGQKLSERNHYPSDFVREYDNWAERGLTSMLAEAAALEHIIEMRESSYLPLAQSCEVVIKEETRHIAHGTRITKRLCQTEEGKENVQAVLNRKWGQVLDLFGSSTSTRSKIFLKWGLRKRSNEEARQIFIGKTRPKLEELGLIVPANDTNRKFQ